MVDFEQKRLIRLMIDRLIFVFLTDNLACIRGLHHKKEEQNGVVW